MCPSDQYDNVCKGEFAEIHAKLDRLDEAIRGNGKPGIQRRMDRIEAAEAVRRRVVWLVVGALVTLVIMAIRQAILGG